MKSSPFVKMVRRFLNVLFVTSVELVFIYFVALSVAGVFISLFGDNIMSMISNHGEFAKQISLEKEEFFYVFIHILCIGFYVITNVVIIVERIFYIFSGKIGKNMRKAIVE